MALPVNTIADSVPSTVVLGTYANPLGTSTTVYQGSLTVTSAGEIDPEHGDTGVAYGAVGVYSNLAHVLLTNQGEISGADAAQRIFQQNGLAGGIGVEAVAVVAIDNSNLIQGGTGGDGGIRSGSTVTGSGGAGGAGVDLSAAQSTLVNSGSVLGGNGSNQGERAGAGGVGVSITAAATVTNSGTLGGGSGGNDDFYGGTGGTAAEVSGGGNLTNDGIITGGAGGDATGYEGSNAPHFTAGAGGLGVDVAANSTFLNESAGSVTGGMGGNNFMFSGATGGVGVNVASNTNITNDGAVTGGAGGRNELGKAGDGGVGMVLGDNVVLTNNGTITGGAGYNNYKYGAGSGGAAFVMGANDLLMGNGKFVGGVNGINSEPPAAAAGRVGISLSAAPHAAGSGATYGYSAVFSAGGGDTLVIGAGASFTGAIAGFDKDDTIRIDNASANNLSFNSATNTLYTTNYGSLHFVEPAGTDFTLTANADGTATLTNDASAACYRRGTRILTPRGEVAVENLSIGDTVTTLHHGARAIRWIGHRRYAGRVAAGDRNLLPVLFRTDSLSRGVPARDLWVSPAHAMYVDGLLIPAIALVNGVSIRQEAAVDDVRYVHLEFEGHEIIVAEGAAAESYVDDDTREQFDNAAEYRRLFPDHVREPARACAPYVEEGHALEAIRARLWSALRQPDLAA